jgi:pimeloyl-ACP methyl ester carboxylesterase
MSEPVEPAEPWVLLHGLGSVAATWSAVMAALGRDCLLVVPELSALGGSRAAGAALTMDQALACVEALIHGELGGRPATVGGLSMGAWMAVRFALARPELVSRLVLVDAAGYRNQEWQRIDALIRVDDLAGVDRLYAALFRRTPWILRRFRRTFLRTYTSPSVRNLLDSLGEKDTFRNADLARLDMPVGLIWGEHDGLFTLEVARAMAASLPHARLYVLPDSGHAVHLESPLALVKAFRQLRRDLPPRDPADRPRPPQ